MPRHYTKDDLGFVSIKEFEHLKSGTDWTSAIVAAMNATPMGGELRFPDGTYNHTGISITKPINIRGAGKYGTILKNTSLVAAAVTVNSAVERGTFRDIGIWGNGTQGYGADATSGKGVVFSNNSVVWTFDNIWMRGHGDWFFYADGNGHVNNVNIINSEFEFGKKGAIHFIQRDTSNQINAINIQNCNFSGFGENGLELWGQSITVQNCAIQACKNKGVVIDGSISPIGQSSAQSIRIDNNYFELCNYGFIFLKAVTTPFARYIFSAIVTNNYGSYAKIPSDTVDMSTVSIVEVQAPGHYSYDNNQVGGFVYEGNTFSDGSGGLIKAILNGNDVLSYDSRIQRGNTTVLSSSIAKYIGLGRAKITDGISERHVIKGISCCVNNTYTIDKSSNITADADLIFDVKNYSKGSLVSLDIPVDTDCTDYTLEVVKKYRDPGSIASYTDYVVVVNSNKSGSQTISNPFDGKSNIMNVYKDYYLVIRVKFNAGHTKTRFHIGNPVIQFSS